MYEDSLSMILLQRLAIIAVVAYVFSHTQAFRLTFASSTTMREKGVLVLFFSAISVAGTYFGIPVEGGLANFRDTGSIVAGLLAGPLVGTATGLISGLHRISLGGFTALECGIATIIGGVLSGYIHARMRPKGPECITGAVTGVAVVLFSMGLILFSARPYSSALSLVTQVALPMSLANALGIAVFIIIIQNARSHQTKIAALQTHQALRIANAALPYLRQGLNHVSAGRVTATIMTMTSASAVAMTNRESVLAHVGSASDHHAAGEPLLTAATRSCLATGQLTVAQNPRDIGCRHEGCPLKSAVVVPLLCREEVAGTLKIYYTTEEAMTALDIEFAQGLGQILSTQLELAVLQQKAELTAKAELKALRAQINPHFLFNSLNTIVSLCRTDAEEARRLIIELSDFFRRSLKSTRDFVPLREELDHVESYLALEKARFGSRLQVLTEIDPAAAGIPVPVFTIQPLVENAVKHGLLSKPTGGCVRIRATVVDGGVEISISDDGQGMTEDVLRQALVYGYGKGTGVGLSNVHERLRAIYGPAHGLCVESREGEGTVVRLRIPLPAESVVA